MSYAVWFSCIEEHKRTLQRKKASSSYLMPMQKYPNPVFPRGSGPVHFQTQQISYQILQIGIHGTVGWHFSSQAKQSSHFLPFIFFSYYYTKFFIIMGVYNFLIFICLLNPPVLSLPSLNQPPQLTNQKVIKTSDFHVIKQGQQG